MAHRYSEMGQLGLRAEQAPLSCYPFSATASFFFEPRQVGNVYSNSFV